MRSCGHLSYLKGKVFWQLWRSVVSEETLAEPFRLPPRDHPASARSDWHGAGAPQHFQLEGKKRRKRRRVRLTGFVASELIASGIGESGSNAKLTRQSALMMTTGLFLFLCYICVSFCPVLNHTLAQFIIVTISPRNELFPCLWSTKQHITKKMDSLKGGP